MNIDKEMADLIDNMFENEFFQKALEPCKVKL